MKSILLTALMALPMVSNATSRLDCAKIQPFNVVKGYKFTVNVEVRAAFPEEMNTVIKEINKVVPLIVGNYDMVSYQSPVGNQVFRPLADSAGADAGITKDDLYPTQELSFTIERNAKLMEQVLKAIYVGHPYEEPVVHIAEVSETRVVPEYKKGGVCDTSPNKWYKK